MRNRKACRKSGTIPRLPRATAGREIRASGAAGQKGPAAQGQAGPDRIQGRYRLQHVQHLRHEGVTDDVSLGKADDTDVAAHAFDAVGDGRQA